MLWFETRPRPPVSEGLIDWPQKPPVSFSAQCWSCHRTSQNWSRWKQRCWRKLLATTKKNRNSLLPKINSLNYRQLRVVQYSDNWSVVYFTLRPSVRPSLFWTPEEQNKKSRTKRLTVTSKQYSHMPTNLHRLSKPRLPAVPTSCKRCRLLLSNGDLCAQTGPWSYYSPLSKNLTFRPY
jgi:hypothetical protein